MCSLAAAPVRLTTIEQRFLRGPSQWSGQSCLVTVLEMGPLARALTTDYPGLGERVLALFPGLHDFAEPLRRGSFIAEVLGRIALELQRRRGAPPHSRAALTVHGRQAQVKIIIAGQTERIAGQAFALATAIMLALLACGALPLGAVRHLPAVPLKAGRHIRRADAAQAIAGHGEVDEFRIGQVQCGHDADEFGQRAPLAQARVARHFLGDR